MTTVVNRRDSHFDVYIGRGTKWGNPFRTGRDGSREDVIDQYRKHVVSKILSGEWQTDMIIRELKGKRLGCTCAPKSCHGDVLVEAIDYIDRGAEFQK